MSNQCTFSELGEEHSHDEITEYFFYLLYQVVSHRDAAFEAALMRTGLQLSRWRALAIIGRLKGCTMKDLARHSTVDRTTLTRAVDQLVGEGLVERSIPVTDRRQVLLSLTSKGEERHARGADILLRSNDEALEGVPPEQRRSVAEAMLTVLRNLKGEAAEALIDISLVRDRG